MPGSNGIMIISKLLSSMMVHECGRRLNTNYSRGICERLIEAIMIDIVKIIAIFISILIDKRIFFGL